MSHSTEKASQRKTMGIICLIVCAVCVFIAIERYNTNANNVAAMNSFRSNGPFPAMMSRMEPATPAASKYAMLFAFLSGIGAGVLLLGKQRQG